MTCCQSKDAGSPRKAVRDSTRTLISRKGSLRSFPSLYSKESVCSFPEKPFSLPVSEGRSTYFPYNTHAYPIFAKNVRSVCVMCMSR